MEKNGRKRTKDPRMQGVKQVMMEEYLTKERRPETSGTLRRNMMRDGILSKTSDGKRKRTARITICMEIMIISKNRSKTVQ